MNYAIIVAGGKGKRFSQNIKKQFYRIGSKTILELTIDKFIHHSEIDRIVLVLPEEDLYRLNFSLNKRILVTKGGKERKDSVLNGLKLINNDLHNHDKILIHDGVRPFVSKKLISNVLRFLEDYEVVIPAIKIEDTLKEVNDDGFSLKTVDRNKFIRAQTPQGFKGFLLNDFMKRLNSNENYTDDASVFESLNVPVKVIEGEKSNIKITTIEDIMNIQGGNLRIGFGFDAHKFTENRKLYLGGVEIDYEYGLEGHSDADVVIHSLIDAILGASSKPDIGELFPDSKNEFKNIRSIELLKRVYELIKDEYLINNIDITVVCEQPKIKDYKNLMKERLSEILDIDEDCINIKGKTTEGLGFTGRKEGIASYSVVSLIKLI